MTGDNSSVRIIDRDGDSIHEIIEVDDANDGVIDVDEVTVAVPTKITKRPHAVANGDLEEDELSQPFVNIHDLFNKFNHDQFDGRITATFVEYSSRMTLCAGTCTFKGPLGGCRIALSEPLLKFRPRSDLISTLLHEMIHAFLFVTEGVAVRDGVDGHGPKFLAHADRINRALRGKANITPYHTFTDEVDIHRVHHWTCNRCSMVIKRAMNRAPAPRDPFWPRHERTCRGSFVKTKEPPKKKKVLKRAPKRRATAVSSSKKSEIELPNGVMRTRRIDSMLAGGSSHFTKEMVSCPVCNSRVEKSDLNVHLDGCLSPGIFAEEPAQEICIPDSDDEKCANPVSLPDERRQQGSSPKATLSFESTEVEGGETRSENLQRGALGQSQSLKEYDTLKELIPNPDLLVSFAIRPLSINQETILNAFNLPVQKFTKRARPKSTAASLLRQVTQKESPFERQRQAKEEMLCHVGGSDLVKETILYRLADEYKVSVERVLGESLVRKNWRTGDCFVIPEGGLEQIRTENEGPPFATTASVPAQNCESVESGTRQKLSDGTRREKAYPEPEKEMRKPSKASKQRADIAKTIPNMREAEQWKIRMENCPVCDIAVCRSELEAHVRECLSAVDLHSFVAEDEGSSAAQERHQSSSRAAPERHNISKETEQSSQPRCPLCDIGVPRDELEQHVQACMLSEGLEGEF